MKAYENAMEHLSFRENFAEETILKAQNSKRKRHKGIAITASIALCGALLFTTAFAVSPTLQRLFIKSEPVKQSEVVSLPTESNIVIENHFESITAQYRKIDGNFAAFEGWGSLLPIEADGKVTLYELADNGELKQANPLRSIEKTLEYKGEQFTLNMEVYGGDIPTALIGDRAVPLADENFYTIWHETQKNVIAPLIVDLTTWKIKDPMANVDFTLPEGTIHAYVSASQNGERLLIHCTMDDGARNYYAADARTGAVKALESNAKTDWFIVGDQIYCYTDRTMCVLNEQNELETVAKNCNYINATYYVHYNEGKNLILLDLRTMQSYEIENGAELLSDVSTIRSNRNGTRLMVSHFAPNFDGLNTDSIAIIDLENAQMYALERQSELNEKMLGWFDNDRVLIAGTSNGEWYINIYRIN